MLGRRDLRALSDQDLTLPASTPAPSLPIPAYSKAKASRRASIARAPSLRSPRALIPPDTSLTPAVAIHHARRLFHVKRRFSAEQRSEQAFSTLFFRKTTTKPQKAPRTPPNPSRPKACFSRKSPVLHLACLFHVKHSPLSKEKAADAARKAYSRAEMAKNRPLIRKRGDFSNAKRR